MQGVQIVSGKCLPIEFHKGLSVQSGGYILELRRHWLWNSGIKNSSTGLVHMCLSSKGCQAKTTRDIIFWQQYCTSKSPVNYAESICMAPAVASPWEGQLVALPPPQPSPDSILKLYKNVKKFSWGWVGHTASIDTSMCKRQVSEWLDIQLGY